MKFLMKDRYRRNYKNKNGKWRKAYLYGKFIQMKQRCYNPNSKDYKDYGGRGVKVEDYLLIFENYVDEVIKLLPKGETINSMRKKKWSNDRINNDGNYERGNLRWASPEKQNRNQRMKKTNTSGYQGVTLQRKKWLAELGYMNKRKRLGCFNTKQEAFIAYCKAYLEYFGQEDYNHMISLHPHWDDQLKQERSNYETVK